jgi:polar amino acid transport system substrate-binding protein
MTILHRLPKLFAFALVILGCIKTPAQAIQFLTEEFPPYNYTKGGEITGSATAVVRALAATLDEPISIQVLPWHRAMEETATGPDKMLFVGARTPEREARFKWIGPILKTDMILLAHKGQAQAITFLKALDTANILVQEQGPCHERLVELRARNIETAMDEMTNARKFIAGRSPLWCGSPDVLGAMLERTGSRIEHYETKFTVGTIEGYILASPDISDAVIARWQNALDKMAASGTLATIYAGGR